MSAVIGALRAVMSLESAAFQKGLTAAEKSLAQFQKKANRIGGQMQKIGGQLSLAVTAPLAAVAEGTRRATNALVELDNQARLAGLSADRFKVLGLAAGEFGIAQEKLADILKDVNDKFGDFAATGQGPLVDFFENIAPKVGLTQEAFAGLASDQALQLYVKALEDANVSQQEMTFYLEAIASDATALLPVFKNNAAAVQEMEARARELGLSLDQDLIGNARETKQQFALLTEVLGLQMQQALVSLAPAISELAKAFGPVIEKVAKTITDLAEGFRALSPETQAFIGKAAALAAAVGPATIALGGAVKVVGMLAGAFKALTVALLANPITAIITAIAVAAYLIYENWEGISAFFSDLFTGIAEVATTTWETIRTEVASWPGRLAELGRAAWDGLVSGLKARVTAVTDAAKGAGRAVVDGIKGVLGIQSPSKVLREVGRNIMDGLGLGIRDGEAAVEAQVEGIGDMVSGLASGAKSAFKDIITGSKSVKEAVGGLVESFAGSLINRGLDSIFGSLFGGFFGFAKGGVVPFASGGVVSQATAFAMPSGIGVMGEAGPEAIMPLARASDGSLGVRAVGGTGGVSISIDARGAQMGVAEEIDRALARRLPDIQRLAVAGVRDAGVRGL